MPYSLDTNKTWFDFSVSSKNSEFGDLAVYSFLETEQICLPYVFAIIGSANINARGMVSDAEADISSTMPDMAADLRKSCSNFTLGNGRISSRAELKT